MWISFLLNSILQDVVSVARFIPTERVKTIGKSYLKAKKTDQITSKKKREINKKERPNLSKTTFKWYARYFLVLFKFRDFNRSNWKKLSFIFGLSAFVTSSIWSMKVSSHFWPLACLMKVNTEKRLTCSFKRMLALLHIFLILSFKQ